MATAVSSIINSALSSIQDPKGALFPQPDLIRWTNEGLTTIAVLVPKASATVTTFALTEGTHQSVPDGYIAIIEVYANMGTNGTTRTSTPRMIDLGVMTRQYPGWQNATTSVEVERVIDDERSEGAFMVYPPQPAAPGQLQCLLSVLPAKIGDLNEYIPVHDKYSVALTEYLLARMHGGNEASGSNFQASQAHWGTFVQMIGADPQVARAYAPKQADFSRGANPGLA